MSTLSTQILVSNEKNLGFLEKWLILEMGQEIYKMSPEHLVVPESKEALKEDQNKGPRWMGFLKGLRSQLEEFPMAKLERFNQQNRVVLDYNPKYKLHIHEFTLTQTSNR